MRKHLPKLAEVVLSLSAPEAKEVYVAGDFNNWRVDEDSRMQATDGTWRKTVNLKSGRYHYRFVIDGKWVDDPNNPNKETNPYGEMNSLLEVNPVTKDSSRHKDSL